MNARARSHAIALIEQPPELLASGLCNQLLAIAGGLVRAHNAGFARALVSRACIDILKARVRDISALVDVHNTNSNIARAREGAAQITTMQDIDRSSITKTRAYGSHDIRRFKAKLFPILPRAVALLRSFVFPEHVERAARARVPRVRFVAVHLRIDADALVYFSSPGDAYVAFLRCCAQTPETARRQVEELVQSGRARELLDPYTALYVKQTRAALRAVDACAVYVCSAIGTSAIHEPLRPWLERFSTEIGVPCMVWGPTSPMPFASRELNAAVQLRVASRARAFVLQGGSTFSLALRTIASAPSTRVWLVARPHDVIQSQTCLHASSTLSSSDNPSSSVSVL